MKRKYLFICLAMVIVMAAAASVGWSLQKRTYVVPKQGVFESKTTDSEEQIIHLSLLDTGRYYLLTPNGEALETGTFWIDKNGVGHLTAERGDIPGEEGASFLVALNKNRCLLIQHNGQTLFLKMIDRGGRVPA